MSGDTVNVESDVVFADGSVLNGLVGADGLALAARPNSRLSIPLVGDLILNEQRIEKQSSPHGNTVMVTVNALRLALDGVLGKGDITISQAMCKASGKNIGKELKIVSATNGQDTSNDVHAGDGSGDGGGLLGGVLGGGDDGGLLGVNHLRRRPPERRPVTPQPVPPSTTAGGGPTNLPPPSLLCIGDGPAT